MTTVGRFMIDVILVVTITDFVMYFYLKKKPERFTIPTVILWIIVTIVPIGIFTWFHSQ